MARLIATIVLAALSITVSDDTQIRLTGARFEHMVQPGESLSSIGARYGVGVKALVACNHLLNRRTLEAGTTLVIDNRHLAAIRPSHALSINVAQRMLFLVRDNAIVAAYPVAVGRRDWPTPTGSFTILVKETNPTWDVPASIREEMRRRGQVVITRVPPSPGNPLGAYWLGLSMASLGIHGTNAPSSVYQAVSHGCLRLHPDDIADLFERVSVGDSGVLIYEPVLIAMIDGHVLLEAHDDVYRRGRDAADLIRLVAAEGGFADRLDWVKVAAALAQRYGIAEDVTREPPFTGS
jgi:L,D-transpeptidase ErfK/SrfK